jgi:hypothetical protein
LLFGWEGGGRWKDQNSFEAFFYQPEWGLLFNLLMCYFIWFFREAATFSIVDGRSSSYENRSINMGSEKYKLKWSKYESNVLNAFKDLFETEALSDVVLFCEGI